MVMTPEDRDLVARTPDVTGKFLNNLFGGDSYHERPQSKQWDILNVNKDAQPYAPHRPGESGLVFTYPGAAPLEDTCGTFLLFFNMNPKLSRRGERNIQYLGTYTKVRIVNTTVELNEWRYLPDMVSGVFQHILPSTRLVGLLLMAHCSVVKDGYVVSILQLELICVKHMQEYLYANRLRAPLGLHPHQMPFANGLNNIKGSAKVSKKQTLGLHLVVVKRCVFGIDPPVTKIISIIPET
jgi:hypothetical protein